MSSIYEEFEMERVTDWVYEPRNALRWWGVARWHVSEAMARHPKHATCHRARHKATLAVARALSKRLNDDHPLPMIGVYADLLSAALDAVDYIAIAGQLVSEFFDDRPRSTEPSAAERSPGDDQRHDAPGRRYHVTVTEVITNWKRVEMAADSPEAVVRRIVEHGDYDPDDLDPQTVEVTATGITPVDEAAR